MTPAERLAQFIVTIDHLTPIEQAERLLVMCPRCWNHPMPCSCHEHPLIAADEENR